MIEWPKIIKLADVVDALDDLSEQVATNARHIAANDARITELEHRYDAVVTERGNRIASLEQELALARADIQRQAWATRTGRQL